MTRAPKSKDFDPEDATPEADRLEGFPHPRETEQLIGQGAAERTLAEALAGGRMHHAWLLSGPEGIGKATLAYRFARAALASPAERAGLATGSLALPPDSPTARQVRALSHPGLMLIRRPWNRDTKKHTQGIPVDEVRRIKGFLQHSAGEGAYRVVIIDRAEEMAAAGANAVLKVLEEPPARVVFLLVSSEPGRLLPTIHSRCRKLDMPPLGEADLRVAVEGALAASGAPGAEAPKSSVPKSVDLALIAALAEGSVRRALTLLTGGAAETHGKIVAMLANLPRLDVEAVHQLADGLTGAANEADFAVYFSLLQGVIARILRRAATGEPMLASEAAFGARVVEGGQLAGWAEAWEAIARDKAEVLGLNLDKKALVIGVWERLRGMAG